MSLTVRLYTADRQLVTDLGDVDDLTFTTKMPGGCDTCDVTLNGQLVDRTQEVDHPQVRQVDVTESGATFLWRGRISRPSLEAPSSTLRFAGWWNSLWDGLYSAPDPGLASPTYPHTLVTALLQQCAPLLSQDTSLIDTGNTTDLTGGSALVVERTRPGDLIGRILQMATATGVQYHAGVYPDPLTGALKLFYAPRPSTATYLVSLSDLDEGWSFEQDWDSVFPSVQVEYTDLSGTRQTSGVFHDTKTQQLLGFDRIYPLDLPATQRYAAETVANVANLFLQENNRPKQKTNALTIRGGYVRDPGGNDVPSYFVRAGDVLRVTDLPSSGDVPRDSLDDKRTFSLASTSYSVAGTTLTVTPESAVGSLTDVVARLLAAATGAAGSF